MTYLLNIIEFMRRTSISYGTVFLLMGGLLGTGMEVLKSTVQTLSQDKYKGVLAHFQKGVLLFLASMTAFRYGFTALKGAAASNPEDFKDLHNFVDHLAKSVPTALENAFKSPADFLKETGAQMDDLPNVPVFVRESGEYMDFINTGKSEVDTEEFMRAIHQEYSSGGAEKVAAKVESVKKSLVQKGWASIYCTERKGCKTIILWADKFEMGCPANAKDLEKAFKDLMAKVDTP